MIVISSALALALATQTNADYPVILWDNIVTISNITADSEADGFPVTNLANPSTTPLQGWRSDSLAEQYIYLDITETDYIDAVGIARHNFGSGLISVTIEGLSADEGATWEELVAEQFLGLDGIDIFRFVPSYLIGLRIKLKPDAVKPRAAVLYVGKLLVFEYGVQVGHTPINYARNRNVVNGRTQAGDFLGRIIVGGTRTTDVSINYLSPDWYRETLDPFMDVSAELPFFWAWRPQTYPKEVGFAWLTSDPRPVPSHLAGYINVQFQMEGIL